MRTWYRHKCYVALCSWSYVCKVCCRHSFPFAVVMDANGAHDPGKGAKNDPAVMDVCFLLLVQVERPPVAISKEI